MFVDEVLHGDDRFDQDGDHVIAGELLGGEDEELDIGTGNGHLFQGAAGNIGVFGQDNPAPFAHLGEPINIGGIGWEVIVMNLDGNASLSEGRDNLFAAEASIDEKCDGCSLGQTHAAIGFISQRMASSIVLWAQL